MIPSPATLGLSVSSMFVSTFAVYAAFTGHQIKRWWNLDSGSERQLALERKTYLVSTVLAYLFAIELFSLFMFVHTADNNHNLFVGAMCAAGSLNVNPYGYPTLIIKVINFIICGVWLVLNYVDNKGYDYPLIREKYKFIMVLSASLVLETILQSAYFLNLRADVITSCCGTFFSEDSRSIAGSIAALPAQFTLVVFFVSIWLTIWTGIYFFVTGKEQKIYIYLCTWTFFFSFIAIISVISVYFYELPFHHCPFCILQREYHYIGYPIYLTLFVGGILGISMGVLERFKETASLKVFIPTLQRRLCLFSLISYSIFGLIVLYPMIFSDFRLFGY